MKNYEIAKMKIFEFYKNLLKSKKLYVVT